MVLEGRATSGMSVPLPRARPRIGTCEFRLEQFPASPARREIHADPGVPDLAITGLDFGFIYGEAGGRCFRLAGNRRRVAPLGPLRLEIKNSIRRPRSANGSIRIAGG